MIKVFIVDDQKSVRTRLEYLIKSVSDFKVVGTADNGLDAITYVSILQPDIVLMDIEIPRLDGLMATKLISEESPKTKILMLSSHDEQEYVTKSMSAGATGYLLKGSSDEEIEQAIRLVEQGFTHMEAELFAKMLPVFQESTEIEQVQPGSALQRRSPLERAMGSSASPARLGARRERRNILSGSSGSTPEMECNSLIPALDEAASPGSHSLSRRGTDDLQPTSNEIVPASKIPVTVGAKQQEITQHQSNSITRQIFAWLIVTLSLTNGLYIMRQWLRKPLPTLSYSEQSAALADIKFTGKVKPAKTFKIAAIAPGIVENIQVQVGEKVEVDQSLLTLKNLAAEDKKKQIIQEQQLTRQQQQGVLQQQQTAKQRVFELEQKINRLKYNLVPLRAKIAQANLQVSLAKSQAEKLPLRQRQDSVPRTKAIYERAKARFNRLKSLYQQGGISQEQLEQAQAELEVAKVDYDTAIAAAAAGTKLEQTQRELSQLQGQLAIQEQQDAIAQLEKQKQTAQLEYQQATEKLELLGQHAEQLNKYQVPQVQRIVRATEAGIITELPVTVGAQIHAGNAVVGLAKLGQLKIEVPVSGRLINALSPHQEALIQIGTRVTAQKFEGKIATVNPLPTENLNYLVEVEFANPTNSLIIGQLAQVQFLPQTMAGGN